MDKQAIRNRLVSRTRWFKWSTRTHSWKMLFLSPIVVAWRKLTLYVNSNGRENWCDVWVSRLYYFQTLETDRWRWSFYLTRCDYSTFVINIAFEFPSSVFTSVQRESSFKFFYTETAVFARKIFLTTYYRQIDCVA